jgi:outer membrane usher protein
LSGRPPPKPVSDPSAPITRWQGTTIGSGFAPFAAPTARDAAGRPIRRASSAYEIVVP